MKKVTSLLALVLAIVCSVNFCFADTAATTAADRSPAEVKEQQSEAAKSPMKDIDGSTDLGKSIQKLYDAGVVDGIPEGDGTFTYRPLNSVTRAEFCKMINITFDFTIAADNIFSDVNPKQWYYVHVLPAIHYGYIQGKGDGTFGGTDNITREQVCVILDRIIKKTPETKPVITDAVSSWAKTAVENIVGLGYMSLEEGGSFRAKENMTRGELALTLDDFAVVKTTDDKTDTEKTDTNKTDTEKTDTSTPNVNPGSGGGSTEDSTPAETSYKITYSSGGGSLSGQKTSYKASDADYTLPTPTRSGYQFMGWFEDKDADVAVAEPVTVLASGSTGNKTYYAKWAKTYTIKYVLHPSEYEKEDDPSILGKLDGTQKKSYCQYDDEYVLPTPTRDDGEEFVGWYEAQTFKNVSGTLIIKDEYKADTIPTGSEGNKTYYAVWQDMVDDSDDTYYYVNDAILAISDIKDLMPLATESGVLGFFETALPQVSSWESQGVLVTKKLVRKVYESEADTIRGAYLELQAAGREQELKDELLQLRGIENLVTIFGINIAFGTGDVEVLD